MKKFLQNLIFVIYAIVAIFVTVCLLSYNDYKVTKFGNNSLLIIDSNDLQPDYYKGQLVIADDSIKNLKVGDKILFYTVQDKEVSINQAKLTKVDDTMSSSIVYTVEGDVNITKEKIIGKSENTKVINNAGTVLSILESRWGFLFIIILPALAAFIHEIMTVASEIKESKESEKSGK